MKALYIDGLKSVEKEKMVKIIVKFPIIEGCEKEYFHDLIPCVRKTREEPGCIEYTPFWDEDKRIMTLFECYKDIEGLNYHLETENYKNDFLALRKYYSSRAVVEKYTNPII